MGELFAKEYLQPGDVVLLQGPVGIGKSVFARGCIRGLTRDPTMTVPSPTYLLEHQYTPIWMNNTLYSKTTARHFDLYRLPNLTKVDWLALGWEDVLYKDDIAFIEWPERALDIIRSQFDSSNGRLIRVTVKQTGERIEVQGDDDGFLREVSIEQQHTGIQ